VSVAAPSICRRIASVTVAAIAAVAILVTAWGLREVIDHRPVVDGRLPGLIRLGLFGIVFGSFIAVPICLMLGLPLWDFAIRSERQRQRDALRFGLIAGALIGAVMAIVGDPGARWFDEPLDFIGYCVTGPCAGRIAHRLGYPRR
jgi:H+/Cl- antiporter ClcA